MGKTAGWIRSVRVGWRIFSLLVAFGVTLYFQQRGLTVAAERIMPELSLSQMQIGWIQWAFVVGYACLQFPGGVVGQRLGARRVLVISGLIAFAATITVPLAPGLLTGASLFATLLVAQVTLGAAQAPFFPTCAGVMQAWLPARRWALAQGILTMGCQCGAALAPVVIVSLMQIVGWQRALIWPALPALVFIAVWGWYARDTPREHSSISAQELAELGPTSAAPVDTNITGRRILAIVSDRSILLLTLSYVCMNYVFYLLSNWSFLYLIQERHFTGLEGGLLASLPPLGAAVGAGMGGVVTDWVCTRRGLRWGYRLVPIVALPGAGALLLIAVSSINPFGAVAALVLAFMLVELTEGAYWAATMRVARADTMAATGVLNTGGNLGGIIGIPIVAYLSGHQAWNGTFVLGAAFAALAAGAWLGVDAARSIGDDDVSGLNLGGRPA
jgi:MFS transporter, ACS family, glucarate transporter